MIGDIGLVVNGNKYDYYLMSEHNSAHLFEKEYNSCDKAAVSIDRQMLMSSQRAPI